MPLWVPEAHGLIVSVSGGMSKGERNRLRVPVRGAMSAQVSAWRSWSVPVKAPDLLFQVVCVMYGVGVTGDFLTHEAHS
ncbi:hypothetical protein AQI88_35665 [Streptomyces cellostaticus]|uniref:Uncharacterized protein n=1 Tax=Streptomyces cellostaticus TaxID=67285 RepID=A0A101NEN1_9ACTN|nr:hypothetical protein [Streptomyces cellostaticus]KUM91752.1 hypothetical protein AQI88_35665 [Streptomyces cellostaticus]GHI04238.1 hypothetical protein Scel_25590 [Streptomyces cellostaticus]